MKLCICLVILLLNSISAQNSTFNATSIPQNTTRTTTVTTTIEATTTLKPTTTKKPATRSKVKLAFIERTTQDNQEVNLVVGYNAKIDCRVKTTDGSPLVPPKMVWLKDDQPLHVTSYRHFPSNMEDVYVLVLENIMTADSGKYKCTADNGFNKAVTTSLVLNINEEKYSTVPEIKEFTPTQPVIQFGQSMQFSCSAESIKDHTPYIQWVKYSSRKLIRPNETYPSTNNTNITTTATTTTTTTTTSTTPNPEFVNRIVTHRMTNYSYIDNDMIYETITLKMVRGEESHLFIANATFEDNGVYTCYVFNQNGHQKRSTNLTVIPVPPLSVEEQERRYFKKYGHKREYTIPLSIFVAFPLFLLVLLITGCIWWKESDNRKNEKKLKEKVVKPIKEKSIQKLPIEKQPLIIPEIMIQSGTSEDSLKPPSVNGAKVFVQEPEHYGSEHSIHTTPEETSEKVGMANVKEISTEKLDSKMSSKQSLGGDNDWEQIDADAIVRV